MNTQFEQQMQSGVNAYFQPKPFGDIDLVDEVRQALLGAGLHANVAAAYDNNRFIVDAVGKPSNVQRHLLNRYWSQQLMSTFVPSMDERYCLIPNGEVSDWLKLFKQKVLPFAIANNLPMSV